MLCCVVLYCIAAAGAALLRIFFVSEHLYPFLEGGCCYAKSSSWLKIVPHITMQRITFHGIALVFLLVSVCCDTAQALVFLLVSICCETAQALVFLLVSICCETAQALVFLLVSICCETAQARRRRVTVRNRS